MTKVVIDIGCARHGNDYSIERLIEEFSPDYFYGFDPVLSFSTLVKLNKGELDVKTGEVVTDESAPKSMLLERKAAWIYDGEVGFREDGLNSWVTELKGAPQVPCFDLADFVFTVVDRHTTDTTRPELILKMDAEGSEYDLLRHLILKGCDLLISLAWVEWHEPDRGRAQIEEEWGFKEKDEDGNVIVRVSKLVEWNW